MRTSIFTTLLSLTALLLPGTPAAAQDCPGDPGYVLTLDDTVALGTNFTIGLAAPGDSLLYLIVAGSAGNFPTQFGTLCIGPPIITAYLIQMPPTGELVLPHNVPCDTALDGMVGVFQFVALGPNHGQYGVSNSQHLTAVDTGMCIPVGDFYSFTQGGWGQECNGGNVGCLRDENFDTVYADSLILGDQDGDDADDDWALVLTSSLAVQNFLPAGGKPGALTEDLVDPLSSPAGSFAGQLASAKLNVDFDDAGIFDALKNQTSVKLGDLVFSGCVNPKLVGMSLREVIDLADSAISGAESVPIDVDNDGVGDIGFGDLSTALDVANNNFDNGTQNNGCMKLP